MTERWIEKFRRYKPEPDTLTIWRMGQSGFLLQTQSALIGTDLYLSDHPMRTRRSVVRAEELTGLDVIFGSHDHPDHIDRAAWTELLAANPKAAVVVPKSLEDDICAAFALPQERVYGLADLQTQRPGACMLTGVASAHELLERDAKGEYLCMGAVIELGGFRIYQPGDTCLYEGLASKLRAIGSLDAMLLPINGRDAVRYRNGILGNMTYQEAVDFGAALQPGILIPAHYDLFQGNLEDPEKFTDYLAVKYPRQRVWVGAIGDYVTLRKGETT